MPPKVSVLVPAYRHERFVAEAIASIYSQTYTDFEVLVTDDGSADGSAELLSRLQAEYGFTLTLNPQNLGLIPSLNAMLAKAEGEYVALLAGDDVWLPEKLAEQVAYMDQHPDVGAHSGNVLRINAEGQFIESASRSLRPAGDVQFSDFLRSKYYFPAPICLLRRRALDAVAAFNPAFSYEDWPLWLALSDAGWRLTRTASVLGHYRIHGANLHKNIEEMERQNYRILAQYQSHALYPASLRAMQLRNFESALEISSAEAAKRAGRAAQLKWRYLRGLIRMGWMRLCGR